MPELPEVEVLARSLDSRVRGRRVARVELGRPQLIAAPAPATFRRSLAGARIESVRRRGKTLWFDLGGAGHWLVHLRMTGWFSWHRDPAPAADRHVLARVTLDRGQLHFRDVRRFGRMWWTRDPDAFFAELGPEPLGPRFTARAFAAALARRRIPVKQALLDPRLVAGVGNIYASEACFRARVDPATPAAALDEPEVRRLRRELRAVLRRAIRLGSTVAPVVEGYRAEARFRDEFRVYGRDGEPCVDCGAPIVRTVLGQRGTFSCPVCQPAAT